MSSADVHRRPADPMRSSLRRERIAVRVRPGSVARIAVQLTFVTRRPIDRVTRASVASSSAVHRRRVRLAGVAGATVGALDGKNEAAAKAAVAAASHPSTAVRVAALMPEGTVRVAESGVRGRDDAVALAAAGYHAVLVGA